MVHSRRLTSQQLEVSKTTKTLIKPRKSEKKPNKKKPIKTLKNPAGSVRFWFYKQKPKKPNQTETGKKSSRTGKTEPNQFEPVFSLKKPNRNRSV
jgi:hypothetical protein